MEAENIIKRTNTKKASQHTYSPPPSTAARVPPTSLLLSLAPAPMRTFPMPLSAYHSATPGSSLPRYESPCESCSQGETRLCYGASRLQRRPGGDPGRLGSVDCNSTAEMGDCYRDACWLGLERWGGFERGLVCVAVRRWLVESAWSVSLVGV
jgi:hypothetical protein